MEAIMVSPATMTEIVLGKLVAYFVLGQGGLAVSVGLGLFVFEVPFRGAFPVLIGISAIFLVVSLAIGLVISTVARNQFVAAQLAFLITFMPALILSGIMFDIQSMLPAQAVIRSSCALLRVSRRPVPGRHGLAGPAAQPAGPARLRRGLPDRGNRPHAAQPGVAAMWRRIRSLIVKEFLMLWKDRKSRFVLMVPPIVQLVLFASAATFEGARRFARRLNEDRAGRRALVRRFEGSDTPRNRHLRQSGDVERDISRRVKAVLHVGQTSPPTWRRPPGTTHSCRADAQRAHHPELRRRSSALPIASTRRRAPPAPACRSTPAPGSTPNFESRWFILPGLTVL
jgi:hypothetical protein